MDTSVIPMVKQDILIITRHRSLSAYRRIAEHERNVLYHSNTGYLENYTSPGKRRWSVQHHLLTKKKSRGRFFRKPARLLLLSEYLDRFSICYLVGWYYQRTILTVAGLFRRCLFARKINEAKK